MRMRGGCPASRTRTSAPRDRYSRRRAVTNWLISADQHVVHRLQERRGSVGAALTSEKTTLRWRRSSRRNPCPRYRPKESRFGAVDDVPVVVIAANASGGRVKTCMRIPSSTGGDAGRIDFCMPAHLEFPAQVRKFHCVGKAPEERRESMNDCRRTKIIAGGQEIPRTHHKVRVEDVVHRACHEDDNADEQQNASFRFRSIARQTVMKDGRTRRCLPHERRSGNGCTPEWADEHGNGENGSDGIIDGAGVFGHFFREEGTDEESE